MAGAWVKEPKLLWSIYYMEKFQVEAVAMFASALGQTVENTRFVELMPSLMSKIASALGETAATNVSKQVEEQSGGRVKIHFGPQDINLRGILDDTLAPHVRSENKAMFEAAQAAAAKFRLPARWDSKLQRILQSIDSSDAKTLEVQANEVLADFFEELKEPLFLYVPPNKRQYFEQTEPPFGAIVAEKFPDAERDIAAAARCFALDEWTASVSHLMRAMERPLQFFANRIGVAFPAPTDLENWKSIVDQMASRIEAEVKRLEGTPKSHGRNSELQFLGDVALDFRHFKNAWRNNVAHGREWYDEREAERVYAAVKHFMQKMAASV